ncbi:uncharacterized protein LOC114365956 [Ostrinia furnacalis]|uniref:uncharacterized protein LOC114365956 n=1 Tax=Ostrinia furnacalis TaxID=93504 RepID=UPI001038AF40|nr:uncharacterized protein LOC114365956 [Ostrinia furnacalis]
MAIVLQSLYGELKEIRTYLIKIGPKRRQGDILINKLEAANKLYDKYNNWVNTYKGNDSEILNYCKHILAIYQEIVDLCQSDTSISESSVTMSTFDLKTALNLLPCMTDTEANTKQLIDNIEYYDSLLGNENCKQNLINFVLKSRLSQAAKLRLNSSYLNVKDLITDMQNELLPRKASTAISTKLEQIKQNNLSISDFGRQLTELFVDLTISQAEGNSKKYEVLKPINEKIAVKKFADGLRNRRLSTIIAARNFSSLKDAIQAAQDEDVSSSSNSGEIMGMSKNTNFNSNYRGRRNNFRGARGQYNTRYFSPKSQGRGFYGNQQQRGRNHQSNSPMRGQHFRGQNRGYRGNYHRSYWRNQGVQHQHNVNLINESQQVSQNLEQSSLEKSNNTNQTFFRD